MIVIGAGIAGAASAFELKSRGWQVSVVTDAPIGAAQSAGATRIFRLSHDLGEHVQAAREALRGWRSWEQRSGVTLLENNGLLISGDVSQRVAHLPDVMQELSGAEHPLSDFEGPWVFESTGASGRIEAALTALMADMDLVLGHAKEARAEQVFLSDGRRLQADRVLVCAGASTHRLLGLTEPEQFAYARFSFPLREPGPVLPPCWIQRDPDLCAPFYALPDGSHYYAIGLSEGVLADMGEEEHLRLHQQRLTEIVRELLPGLEPVALRPIRCQYPSNPEGAQCMYTHDGWQLLEEGGVVGLTGPNLFKFAPYLGELAADKIAAASA